MDTDGVMQIILIVFLVGLSAFFSSAETSFTTVNKVRLKSMAEDGKRSAITALTVLESYGKLLSTILIGNNIVNITASSLATALAIRINLAVGIATGLMTVTILLCGEIIPKNFSNIYAEKIVLAYSPIILLLMKILTPVIFIIEKFANGILRLFHVDPNYKESMTETELKTYVDVSHEDGVIESEEREIIYNVFDFSDALAKDIMIPRIDMKSVNIEAGYAEVLTVFKEFMYTRLPVYQDDKDNIIGIINMKDFIFVEDVEQFSVRDIMREAYYTYEYKKTADLMIEMREKTINIAFVLNEYGATEGMITLEDLLEEIVGEIRDEYDADEETLIQQIEENSYLVEGSMKLDDINNVLDTELVSEDYDSIGGLMIEYLDRLPEDGEKIVTKEGIELKVRGISQNRIIQVLMTLPMEKDENIMTGTGEPADFPVIEEEFLNS